MGGWRDRSRRGGAGVAAGTDALARPVGSSLKAALRCAAFAFGGPPHALADPCPAPAVADVFVRGGAQGGRGWARLDPAGTAPGGIFGRRGVRAEPDQPGEPRREPDALSRAHPLRRVQVSSVSPVEPTRAQPDVTEEGEGRPGQRDLGGPGIQTERSAVPNPGGYQSERQRERSRRPGCPSPSDRSRPPSAHIHPPGGKLAVPEAVA